MSFCFAEKISIDFDDEHIDSAHVICDTKVSLKGAVKANWDENALKQLDKYGLAKTIIINPHACLSFAGNNIMLVYELLNWLSEQGACELDEFIERALEIHKTAKDLNDIEFLILSKEDIDMPIEIISIKEGIATRNCHSAWIGSYEAFKSLQEIRLRKQAGEETTITDFWNAITDCNDDTVGGFPIEARLFGDHFEYGYFFSTWIGKSQIIQPGETMKLIDTTEDGGFTITIEDCEGEPMVSFAQKDFCILYTKKYRYNNLDSYNPASRYLLLPILIDINTKTIL